MGSGNPVSVTGNSRWLLIRTGPAWTSASATRPTLRFVEAVRCVRLAKRSAVAFVVSEEDAIGTGSQWEFTCETSLTEAETEGRVKKAPAPAEPRPSKTEIPMSSSGEKEAVRVREMEERDD